jgi:hypothetical protein
MVQATQFTLPADVEREVREISLREGVSLEQVVGEAVRQHVFLKRFRSLRERLSFGLESLTDEDVFDQIS